MIRSALGRLSGKSRTSTQRGVYQPPRCQPTCTSHGQTCSAGAVKVRVHRAITELRDVYLGLAGEAST